MRKDCICPINAGSLPVDIHGLVIRNVINVETVIESALTQNLKLSYNAFTSDPLVNIGLRESKSLFDEMISNTKNYLKGYGL